MINPSLNPAWVTHNMDYYRTLMCVDAAAPPVLSPGNVLGCLQAHDDVAKQAKE